MDRTNKLMAAFASFFKGKPASGADQTESQPDEPWKTDPQVRKAADTILPWLNAWTPDSGPEYSEPSRWEHESTRRKRMF